MIKNLSSKSQKNQETERQDTRQKIPVSCFRVQKSQILPSKIKNCKQYFICVDLMVNLVEDENFINYTFVDYFIVL